MKKIWLAALLLPGCSASPPPLQGAATPSGAATPQAAATVSPPATLAPPPPPPPPPPPSATSDVPPVAATPAEPPAPSVGTAAQAGDDASRSGQVARLRSEIRVLETQKAQTQRRRDQLERERLDRDRDKPLISSPSDAETFARDDISRFDNEMAAKQRQIDTLMLTR